MAVRVPGDIQSLYCCVRNQLNSLSNWLITERDVVDNKLQMCYSFRPSRIYLFLHFNDTIPNYVWTDASFLVDTFLEVTRQVKQIKLPL